MNPWDIAILVTVILGVIVAGLYFLNRWATKKAGTQQTLIDKNKQTVSIYVIDKKRDYAKNINLPKAVADHLPRIYRLLKMYFVQAKVGPQIMTFLCDKKVFRAIPTKKTVKVDVAGIYIMHVKGMKTDAELKALRKEKKTAQKQTEQRQTKKTKEK